MCPFVIEFTRAHLAREKSIHSAAHRDFCLQQTTDDDNYNITAPFVHSRGEFMSSYELTSHLCGTKVSIYDA